MADEAKIMKMIHQGCATNPKESHGLAQILWGPLSRIGRQARFEGLPRHQQHCGESIRTFLKEIRCPWVGNNANVITVAEIVEKVA